MKISPSFEVPLGLYLAGYICNGEVRLSRKALGVLALRVPSSEITRTAGVNPHPINWDIRPERRVFLLKLEGSSLRAP